MCARALPFLAFLAPLSFAPTSEVVSPPKQVVDCNRNKVPDDADIAAGLSNDFDGDGAADECCEGECQGADCNDNDIEDTFDIVLGNSLDCNCNGIPDECDANPAPCDPPGRNGRRGGMTPGPSLPMPDLDAPVCGTGSPSVSRDDLALLFSGLAPNSHVVIVAANLTLSPQGGLHLAKASVQILGATEAFDAKADAFGRVAFANPLAHSAANFVQPGETLSFQCLFQDPKTGTSGFTRSYLVTFEP